MTARSATFSPAIVPDFGAQSKMGGALDLMRPSRYIQQMPATSLSNERWTAYAALGLIALALFMGYYNLDGYLMNNDEETYLYDAWRVSLGEVPYADFLVVQTPLSFYLVAALFKIFGPSVWWARALSYLFVLGAAFFIYGAAQRFLKFDRLAALCCAGIFLFSKHVYFLGRSFMPDDAMLFFSAAALYFALQADAADDEKTPGRAVPVFLFGFFAGLAALAKLNAVLLLAGYGLYAVTLGLKKKEPFQAAVRRVFLVAAGFLATFGLIFSLMLLLVPGTFLATFGVHAAKAEFALSDLPQLWKERVFELLGNHTYGIIPVAVAGMFFRPVFRDRKRTLLVLTILAVLVQMLMPITFYLRYVVIAWIPLAFFFGDGASGLAAMKKGVRKTAAVGAASILVLLCLGPTFHLSKLRAYDMDTRDVAEFVRLRTAPADYIFGETPFANFYAQRPCPPGLVDVSMARTRSGQVSPADIRRECERYKVRMILVERGKAAHNLKNLINYTEFQAYLDASYDRIKTMRREFLEVDIYLRKPGV
ncbi:phospholipid carrier-dependent glycosyltransferase [bacterium]|nr:MAG: phospholipid carrier-dependent glycosyltransferase [bacterium]